MNADDVLTQACTFYDLAERLVARSLSENAPGCHALAVSFLQYADECRETAQKEYDLVNLAEHAYVYDREGYQVDIPLPRMPRGVQKVRLILYPHQSGKRMAQSAQEGNAQSHEIDIAHMEIAI